MKKERIYNSYLIDNIAESANHLALVQITDKYGQDDMVIRVNHKKNVIKFFDENDQKSQPKEQPFYEPNHADHLLEFKDEPKIQIFQIVFVNLDSCGEANPRLAATSNYGMFIFSADFKKKNAVHDRQSNYMFTGLAATAQSIFCASYNGLVEKTVFVVCNGSYRKTL
jgi:hypothetical protein